MNKSKEDPEQVWRQSIIDKISDESKTMATLFDKLFTTIMRPNIDFPVSVEVYQQIIRDSRKDVLDGYRSSEATIKRLNAELNRSFEGSDSLAD